MAEFKINRGVQANYDAMASKDSDAIYVCIDTGRCYLGDRLLSPRVSLRLTGGMKLYYNGVDVTESSDLDGIINSASANWYGSMSAYNELVQGGTAQAGVLYHIQVQSDWSEDDPNALGYIKNQPNLLDMEFVDDEHALRFFYTKYNREITI